MDHIRTGTLFLLLALPVPFLYAGPPGSGSCRNLSVLRFSLQESPDIEELSGFEAYQKICLESFAFGLSVETLQGEVDAGALLGLDAAAGELDAEFEGTRVSLWLEADRPLPDTRWRCFGAAGLGLSLVDIESESDPDPAFALRDSDGEEVVAGLVVGLRYHPQPRWFLETAVRGSYHFTDLDLRDSVSGQNKALDDYGAFGLSVGLGLVY